jgi:F-type H+-transporting ATPase subunit a
LKEIFIEFNLKCIHLQRFLNNSGEQMQTLFRKLLFLLVFSFPIGLLAASTEGEKYDPVSTVMHHISDANEFHIWKGIHLPLPCMVYAPEQGWSFFLSSVFHHGQSAYDRYVIHHGRINRIADLSFPMGKVDVGPVYQRKGENGKEASYIEFGGKEYKLDRPSTLDGGILGGGITSFYDFSITKNVFTMLLAGILLIWIFLNVSKGYRTNRGKSPKGIQSLMEVFFVFIRDEVTKPMIGEKKYEAFQPFIMTLFFFILFCNLFGLIPFFPGGVNITGNLAVTLTLAIFTFIVTNINGNKHYWQHVFWMPGIPAWVKIILTPVEIMALFIKPFSLMIRLFANISAGHIIILSLIGLIFLFGDNGQSVGGAVVGGFIGMLFTAFMNLIELLVAFLQAFIFSILTASYIGAAVEEHHHEHEEAH